MLKKYEKTEKNLHFIRILCKVNPLMPFCEKKGHSLERVIQRKEKMMKLSKVYQLKMRRTFAAVLTSAIVLTSFSVPVFAEEIQEEAVQEELAVEEGLAGDEEVITASGDNIPKVTETPETSEKTPETVSDDGIDTSKDADYLKEIGTATFDATYKDCSAEYQKNGKVKLKWRVSGAKYAKIYTVVSPQSGKGIVEKKKNNYDEYIKGRSFIDEQPDEAGSVYLVCVYDKSYSLLKTFITIPSTYVMSARNQEKDVAVTIAGLKGGCDYKILKAVKKSGNPYDTLGVYKASDMTATSVADRLAYIFTDAGQTTIATSDFSQNKKNKNYYKVQAIAQNVNVAGFKGDLESKLSKFTLCTAQRYAAPIISYLEGTEEHRDGCKSEVTIWFAKPVNDLNDGYAKLGNSKATIEIYKTVNGKALTLVETVKGSALKENSVGTLFGASFTGAPAEDKYSYVIRYVQDSKYSEYSNAYDYSFHFQEVNYMTATNAGAKKVRLRWNTEQCATKYAIYRTVDTFTSEAAAQTAVELMKSELGNKNTKAGTKTLKNLGKKVSGLNGLKLTKTVTNTLATYDEMETDIGGLQAGVYYGFLIVPMDTKYGYDDAGCIASYVKIGAPASFKYDSKGTAGFKLSWGSVPRATGYRLERVTVSSQDGLEDWDGLGNIKEMGFNYTSKDYASNTRKVMVNSGSDKSNVEVAVPGEIYLYRILTLTGDGVSEPARERFAICAAGPKAPTNVTSTMLRKGTSSEKSDNSLYWESKASKGYLTLSGNAVLKRGIRVSFTAADKKNTDHYDVYKSADAGISYEKLGTLVQGSQNKGNTYKKSSSKINFYDTDLKRGVSYVYKIVPVGTNGTEGLASYVDFCVASTWRIYAKNNSGYNSNTCADKKTAMPVKAGETYRFYIDFYKEPLATVTDVTVNDNSTFSIVGKGTEEYYSFGLKLQRSYVDIEVAKSAGEGDAKELTFKYAGRYDDSTSSGKEIVPNQKFYLKVK